MSNDAKRYWAQRKKPLGETLHDKLFNPAPPVTQEMVLSGVTWRKDADQKWIECCSTCGSNCGQCGMTARLGNFNTSSGEMMDMLAANVR